jgi:hypothetical protein
MQVVYLLVTDARGPYQREGYLCHGPQHRARVFTERMEEDIIYYLPNEIEYQLVPFNTC